MYCTRFIFRRTFYCIIHIYVLRDWMNTLCSIALPNSWENSKTGIKIVDCVDTYLPILKVFLTLLWEATSSPNLLNMLIRQWHRFCKPMRVADAGIWGYRSGLPNWGTITRWCTWPISPHCWFVRCIYIVTTCVAGHSLATPATLKPQVRYR